MNLRQLFLDLIGIGISPPMPQSSDTVHDLRNAAALALAQHRISGRAAADTLGALTEQHRSDTRPSQIRAESDRMRETLGNVMRGMR